MQDQKTGIETRLTARTRQRVMPCVCVADAKLTIRTFIAGALEELGFATVQCARAADLEGILAANRVDLVVIGLSVGGIEACVMVELLAAQKFGGQVLIVGPRHSPMVSAVRELGHKLGLAMLPILPTPFGSGDVRNCVAALLPSDTPTVPSPVAAAPRGKGGFELRYQAKIDTRKLALTGATAIANPAHAAGRNGQDVAFASADSESDVMAAAMRVIGQTVEDWRYFSAHHGHVEIAINLPLAFFRHPNAIEALCRQMPDHPTFQGLIVELNAAEVIRNLELARNVARQLRHRNIAISVAKLAIEWPSFLSLHDLPFVEFKIDQRLVAGCADDRVRRATCRRVLELADAMGARTVADGVASRSDFLAVRDLGFHQAQGPLFGAPVRAEEFARGALRHSEKAPG